MQHFKSWLSGMRKRRTKKRERFFFFAYPASSAYHFTDFRGYSLVAHPGEKMIDPVKLGIKADPPALIFVYKMWGRLRMRTMPIRNLWPTTSTRFILEDIRARHDILLGVPDDIIIKMIDVLKSLKAGHELEDALAKLQLQPSNSIKEQNHYNPPCEIRLKDGQMEREALKEKKSVETKQGDGKKEKPYSFMDKRLTDEDTDFDLNDDLPLDELDGNSDEDFWR